MVDRSRTRIPETVRASELAEIIGVAPPTISHLAVAGRVVRRGTRYALAESVRAYCDHLRSPAARAGRHPDGPADPLKAERIRQAREAADKLALQNAAARGELLDRGEVEREWADILRRLRGAMLAVPTRAAGRLGHLTAHDLSELDHGIRAALAEAAQEPESDA